MHGYLYLPQFGILYTPFTWPPKRLGEVLWRLISLGLYASAIWRLAKLAGQRGGSELFPLVTLLSVLSSLGGARNGQVNMPLAGLLIHATVDLADRRWWWAAVSLAGALALKPLALVMLLLVAGLYRPVRWRLGTAVAAVLIMPLLFGGPAYGWSQYQQAVEKMVVASRPQQGFCDLGALLRSMGIHGAEEGLMALQALAAPATLALAWVGKRRWGEPCGAILTFSLAACYLMLFNPRTETNSYLILAPAVAVLAAWRLFVAPRSMEGWMLAAIAVGLGCDNFGSTIDAWTDHWFKPVLALVFLGYLANLVLADRPPAEAFPAAPPAAGLSTRVVEPSGTIGSGLPMDVQGV